MNCSVPGFSVHGISQARILEWAVIPFSTDSSWPGDQIHASCNGRQILYHWATKEASFILQIDIEKQCPIIITGFASLQEKALHLLASFLLFCQVLSQWGISNSSRTFSAISPGLGIKLKVKVKSLSHVRVFVTPWTVAHQAPPSMESSRQEYWSGWPFPSPGDLPNPGTEPRSLTLRADALPSEPPQIWTESSMNKCTPNSSRIWRMKGFSFPMQRLRDVSWTPVSQVSLLWWAEIPVPLSSMQPPYPRTHSARLCGVSAYAWRVKTLATGQCWTPIRFLCGPLLYDILVPETELYSRLKFSSLPL